MIERFYLRLRVFPNSEINAVPAGTVDFSMLYQKNVFDGQLKKCWNCGIDFGVLLEYPTTIGFQWGHLKNGPYTYTVSGGNGRVF